MTIQQMLLGTASGDVPFDYEFNNEVHYGNGSAGSGGTQNYHTTGDGTMPAISLGSAIQNWDMFFEAYISTADMAADYNDWVICTDGYNDTNGFLLGFYDNNVNGEMSIAHPDGAYEFYTQYALPADQWNYVKLEWRGGSTFKIWQKSSANASYTNRYSVTHNGTSQIVYSATNWNFIVIGQGAGFSGQGYFQNQFYGKIRNFGLKINANVRNL